MVKIHPNLGPFKVSSSRDGQRFEEELGKHLEEEKIDVVLNSLSISVIEKDNMNKNIWGFPKIRGTPKWMVYKENPIKIGDFRGTTIFGNTHILLGNTIPGANVAPARPSQKETILFQTSIFRVYVKLRGVSGVKD